MFSTRNAIHVGGVIFQGQTSTVSARLSNDVAKSELANLIVVLESGIKVMYYSGTTDILCHPTGNMNVFDNADWSGKSAWDNAEDEPWTNDEGLTAGYVTRADNLYYFRMPNAGHAVPRFKPANSLRLFSQFIDGTL